MHAAEGMCPVSGSPSSPTASSIAGGVHVLLVMSHVQVARGMALLVVLRLSFYLQEKWFVPFKNGSWAVGTGASSVPVSQDPQSVLIHIIKLFFVTLMVDFQFN